MPKDDRWRQARAAAERASSLARDAARSVTDEARALGREAREQWELDRATDRARELKQRARVAQDRAEEVLGRLKRALEEPDDRTAVVDAFCDALAACAVLVDREADAVSIGEVRAAGLGVHTLTGSEVRWVRGGAVPAHLVVGRWKGRAVRLSFEASAAAYVACSYGAGPLLRRPLLRRGADAQLVVASASLFVATAEGTDGRAAGWLGGLNAGLGMGVPVLSELAVFQAREEAVSSFPLAAADARRIAGHLDNATDRSRLRGMARRLIS